MPICITCSTPVKNLYTTYSKADDRSLGKGVRLTQCPKCKHFADKYVEHDYVVLFIDLVLIKPQVYRHLLFNRLGRADDKLDPSILRLGILLVLFDVYITWARIERSNDPNSTSSEFANAPIVTQYLFFLTLNVVATLAQHITIRLLVQWFIRRLPKALSNQHRHHLSGASIGSTNETGTHSRSGSANQAPLQSQRGSPNKIHPSGPSNQSPTVTQPDENYALPSRTSTSTNLNADGVNASSSSAAPTTTNAYTIGPGHASPSAISTALLVSSCTKLFPILLVIWPISSSSDDGVEEQSVSSAVSSFTNRASNYIGWIVLLNNVEALHILLDCGYMVAGGVAVAGVLSRWLAEGWLLGLAGLVRDGGGYGDGPVSDVLRSWAWISGKT